MMLAGREPPNAPFTASTAGWRKDDALKAMYLTLAQQWLDIAEIGDEVDRQRYLEELAIDFDIL